MSRTVPPPRSGWWGAPGSIYTLPSRRASAPCGGLFTGAEGIKSPEQVAKWGGVAGEQFDPCYHLACDTYDNVSAEAMDLNSDAVATAVIHYAMSTAELSDRKDKVKPKALASVRAQTDGHAHGTVR